MVLSLLAIILTLILVVGIHEMGHAIAARIFDVKIKKISIGFGKPVFQWQSSTGCQWIWAILPLGGYVTLYNTRITPEDSEEYSHCFDKKPIWIRIIILLAGAAANLIAAWFIFILIFYFGLSYNVPQIQSVEPNSVAMQAGLAPGDRIVSVEGRRTISWQDVGMELTILWGQDTIKIGVGQFDKAGVKAMTLNRRDRIYGQKQQSLLKSLGIIPNKSIPSQIIKADTFVDAMLLGKSTFIHTLYFFVIVLKHIVTGVIPFSMLLGPLGIFAVSLLSIKQGIIAFMYFVATFSVACALVNVLPLPGLDGGSVLYTAIEKIRGKPMSVALEVLLYQLMFIGFCILLVQLVVNDLGKIVHLIHY